MSIPIDERKDYRVRTPSLLQHYEKVKAGVKTAEEENEEAKQRIEADKNPLRQGGYNTYYKAFPNDPYKYSNAELSVLGSEMTQFGTATLGVDAKQAFEEKQPVLGTVLTGLTYLSAGAPFIAKPASIVARHIARRSKVEEFLDAEGGVTDVMRTDPPPSFDATTQTETNIFDIKDIKRKDKKGNFAYPEVARSSDPDAYMKELQEKAKPFSIARAQELGIEVDSYVNPKAEPLSKFYSGAIEAIDNMTEETLAKRMIGIKKEDGQTLIKENQLENYFKPLIAKGLVRNADYQYIVNKVLKNDPRIYQKNIVMTDDPVMLGPSAATQYDLDMPRLPSGYNVRNFNEIISKQFYDTYQFGNAKKRNDKNLMRDFVNDIKLKNILGNDDELGNRFYPLRVLQQLMPLNPNRFLMSRGSVASVFGHGSNQPQLVSYADVVGENSVYGIESTQTDRIEDLLRQAGVADYTGQDGIYPQGDLSYGTMSNSDTIFIDADYLRYLIKNKFLDRRSLRKDVDKYETNVIDGNIRRSGSVPQIFTDEELLRSGSYIQPEVELNIININRPDGKNTGKYVDIDLINNKDLATIAQAMTKDLLYRYDSSLVRNVLSVERDSVIPVPTIDDYKRAIRLIDEEDLAIAKDLPADHSMYAARMTPIEEGTHYLMPSGDMLLYKQFPETPNQITETSDQTLERLRDALRTKVLARQMQIGQYADLAPDSDVKNKGLINLDRFKEIAKNELESGEGAYTVNFDDRPTRTQYGQEQYVFAPPVTLEGNPQKGTRQYFISFNAKNLDPSVTSGLTTHDSTEGTLGYVRVSNRDGKIGNQIIRSGLRLNAFKEKSRGGQQEIGTLSFSPRTSDPINYHRDFVYDNVYTPLNTQVRFGNSGFSNKKLDSDFTYKYDDFKELIDNFESITFRVSEADTLESPMSQMVLNENSTLKDLKNNFIEYDYKNALSSGKLAKAVKHALDLKYIRLRGQPQQEFNLDRSERFIDKILDEYQSVRSLQKAKREKSLYLEPDTGEEEILDAALDVIHNPHFRNGNYDINYALSSTPMTKYNTTNAIHAIEALAFPEDMFDSLTTENQLKFFQKASAMIGTQPTLALENKIFIDGSKTTLNDLKNTILPAIKKYYDTFSLKDQKSMKEKITNILEQNSILDENYLLIEELQSDLHNQLIRKGKDPSADLPLITHDDYTEKLIQSAIIFAKKKGINKVVVPNHAMLRQARGGTEELVPNPQKPGEMMKKYVGGMSEDVVQGAYVKGVQKATNKLKKIFGKNINISKINLMHTLPSVQDKVSRLSQDIIAQRTEYKTAEGVLKDIKNPVVIEGFNDREALTFLEEYYGFADDRFNPPDVQMEMPNGEPVTREQVLELVRRDLDDTLSVEAGDAVSDVGKVQFALEDVNSGGGFNPKEATVIDITDLDFDPEKDYFKYNKGGYVGNTDTQMSELFN